MAIEILPAEHGLPESLELWRYMKVSTFLLLLEGCAFWPSVATLKSNDLLEGGLGAEPPWFVSAMFTGDKEADSNLERWLLERAEPGEQIYPGDDFGTAQQNSRLYARIYMRELAKRRAVWCWYSSTIESSAMWSIYGPNGLAIRTSLSALSEALPDSANFQIGQIEYIDRRPCGPHHFNPESKWAKEIIHRPHLIKAYEYAHEREIRITTDCSPHKSGILLRGITPQLLVQEIVFSPIMPRMEARAVANAIAKYPWEKEPPFRQSSLSSVELDWTDPRDKTLSESMDESFGNAGLELRENLPPLLARL